MASCLPTFGMACDICGCVEDSDVHVLLERPLAECIWSATSMDKDIFGGRFRTARDCLECAPNRLSPEELGEFIAILWECWNARNRFIFGKPDNRLDVLGDRAMAFVRSFWEATERFDKPIFCLI